MTFGCGVRIRDLPFREYPFVSGFEFLADIEEHGEDIKKKSFVVRRPTFPLFVYFRLNQVEGEGVVSLNIYDENRQRVFEKKLSYGKPEVYYDYITIYQQIQPLPGQRFYLTIFYGKEMIYAVGLELEQNNPGDNKR